MKWLGAGCMILGILILGLFLRSLARRRNEENKGLLTYGGSLRFSNEFRSVLGGLGLILIGVHLLLH